MLHTKNLCMLSSTWTLLHVKFFDLHELISWNPSRTGANGRNLIVQLCSTSISRNLVAVALGDFCPLIVSSESYFKDSDQILHYPRTSRLDDREA